MHRSQKEIENSYINKREVWDLAGGGLRFFESSPKGLLREIKEETDLDVSIIEPFTVYDVIKPNIHMTIITYLCTCDTYDVKLSEEHDAFYWLTLDELMEKDIPKWLKKEFEIAFEKMRDNEDKA